MWTGGKIGDAWLGPHWLQAWDSLYSSYSQTLLNLEASLARSIFSWVLWWARILGLQP
jgi:hypothetical protein